MKDGKRKGICELCLTDDMPLISRHKWLLSGLFWTGLCGWHTRKSVLFLSK